MLIKNVILEIKMKVYIAYKFKDKDLKKLRKKLEKLSDIVENLGHKTFIFFRDVQKWKKTKMNVKRIFKRAMKEIEKCDIILAECSEKARGVYFEIGYAKAKGKKVIVIHKKGTDVNALRSAADKVIEYKDFEDLEKKFN